MDLIKKYNVPVPRYTSYPTVPFWRTDRFDIKKWENSVVKGYNRHGHNGISLYLHLPFCEQLCTYCACTTRITKNHKVEEVYIGYLLKEWKHYLKLFPEKPLIKELHLGGGTPTFFSPDNLKLLINGIKEKTCFAPEAALSFEGHPNNTTKAHLKALKEVGFTRVSYGIQDLDFKVQKAINRMQPLKNVVRATEDAKAVGFDSINYDLIYGLPFQTLESIEKTIKEVLILRPDRIAFYSYAHVPWLKPGQRAYTEKDLPSDQNKRKLYESGRQQLLDAGYLDVGMDHFALPNDALCLAAKSNQMHRNFMGYTVTETDMLIGLGASAISDAKYAYAQNEKKVEEYYKQIDQRGLAVTKGHVMTSLDLINKDSILDLTCKGFLKLKNTKLKIEPQQWLKLYEMQKEGIIQLTPERLDITQKGMAFLRNICAVFDVRMQEKKISNSVFSKSI